VLTIEIEGEEGEDLAVVLRDAGADEVSMLGGDESHIRTQLD